MPFAPLDIAQPATKCIAVGVSRRVVEIRVALPRHAVRLVKPCMGCILADLARLAGRCLLHGGDGGV